VDIASEVPITVVSGRARQRISGDRLQRRAQPLVFSSQLAYFSEPVIAAAEKQVGRIVAHAVPIIRGGFAPSALGQTHIRLRASS
jgi:hypothetical protein